MSNKYVLIWVSTDFTKSTLFLHEIYKQNDKSRGMFILAYKNEPINKGDLFITILGNSYYIDKCFDKRKDNNIIISKHTTNNPDMLDCYKIVTTNDGDIIPCEIYLNNQGLDFFYKIDTTIETNINLIENIHLGIDDIIWDN